MNILPLEKSRFLSSEFSQSPPFGNIIKNKTQQRQKKYLNLP